MSKTTARQIGSKIIVIGVTIGLLSAYTILLLMGIEDGIKESLTGFFEFVWRFWPNFLVAVLSLYFFGYFLGRKAGHDIIIRKGDTLWVAFKTSMLTLWFGTFFGSLVGFFEEGIPNMYSLSGATYDYIFKPLYWVTIFGVFPVLLISIWLGKQIKKLGIKAAKKAE